MELLDWCCNQKLTLSVKIIRNQLMRVGGFMSQAIYENLQKLNTPKYITQNAKMSDYTTFKVGGSADFLVEIHSKEQLMENVKYLELNNISYLILGNGSNLLFSDNGYRGVILHLNPFNKGMEIDGEKITVSAGEQISQVAEFAMKNGLTGLEFAAGIPGTIGGAIIMNAGAYDGEMKDVVYSVTFMNPNGRVVQLGNEELDFKYRSSILKLTKAIVIEIEFKLSRGEKDEILAKMNDFLAKRKEKQPLMYPNAGSTFKRPVGNYAGKLIMEAGLSGYRVGGASVSTKHCGFIINDKNASSQDIRSLIDYVIQKVSENSGVELETEVIVLPE